MPAAVVLCLSVLFSLCLADREVILHEGAFSYPFVHDEDIRHSDDSSILYVTVPHRCVNVFYLTAEAKEGASIVVERISGVNADGAYTWTAFAKSTITTEEEQTLQLDPAPSCGSTWRITISSDAVTWKELSLDAEPVVQFDRAKRAAVTCTYDPTALYPPECSSASDGALCIMATELCGCGQDNDCFGNTDFPHCVIASGQTTGFCDRCTSLSPSGGTNYADHYFCRTRYPGFTTHPTDGSNLPNEKAAPANYFREYCVRDPPASSGACQRCNQAPLLTFAGLTPAQSQGASGTVHCSIIRPTTAPICMDMAYFALAGGTYDVNLRGACVPCTVNGQCYNALPKTPICNTAGAGNCIPCAANNDCSTLPGKNCQADGSCFSCTTNADCGAKDGGEKAAQTQCNVASGICVDPFTCTDNPSCVGQAGANCQKDKSCLSCTSNANCGTLDGGEVPNQVTCNTGTGICGPCATNVDCTGTGGNNCQADGSCLSCTNDGQCGALDGGMVAGQPKCDTSLNICVTPFSCTDNASCQNTPGSGGNNCQVDFLCISCTGTGTCGAKDGGEVPAQPNCNIAQRVCVNPCTSNGACIGTQGNNCMANGICVTCTTNNDCTTDGGEVPGQALCDVPSGICTSPCGTNADCPAGSNCQADGTCIPCTTSSCGILDGGEVPGQPICLATGLCGPCGSNSDCIPPLSNCGFNGQCYNCGAPGNTCGAQDGPPTGPGSGQQRCDTEIGLCVDYCTLDEHCTDSCVPYCNVQKGCCVECKDDTHCPHSNWRGLESGLNFCSTQSGICTPGCSYDFDCSGATPACDVNTRTCVECVHDYHCTDSGCGDDLTCGGGSSGGGSSYRGIAIAALVLACLGFCLVLVVIGVVATGKAGPEHV